MPHAAMTRGGDVDTRSDDNRALIVRESRVSRYTVLARKPRRDDNPVKGFPLSNNTGLLHGDVPLLYFAVRALGPNCPGHCYKPEFCLVPIIKRQIACQVYGSFVSFRAPSPCIIRVARSKFSISASAKIHDPLLSLFREFILLLRLTFLRG